MTPLIKHPSAWMPMAMSGAALALLLGYVALYGVADVQAQQDEGSAAHLFQLLMAGQAFVIVFFALRWLPQAPKHASLILALQLIAALVPFSILLVLER